MTDHETARRSLSTGDCAATGGRRGDRPTRAPVRSQMASAGGAEKSCRLCGAVAANLIGMTAMKDIDALLPCGRSLPYCVG